METKYIYAASRANALSTNLLSETQLERLLSAKDLHEAFKALQDTFLAPYLSEHEKTDINKALDLSMLEAKNILSFIAPDKHLLEILWVKYDFYNIKAIIKGKKAGFEDSEIKEKCSEVGVYPPDKLIRFYDEKKLGLLNKHLAKAAEVATAAKEVFEIDITMNIYYFETIKEVAKKCRNTFINDYVALLIDFFNLEAALRVQKIGKENYKDVFVEGGTIPKKELDSQKNILETYKKFGGEKVWSDSIEGFEKTGDFSLLEKCADEYILSFLKERSANITSPAPLFAYFSAKKNNAQTIRAIMVAKQAGLPEKELRIILRRLYT